jgi:hypothetical protein
MIDPAGDHFWAAFEDFMKALDQMRKQYYRFSRHAVDASEVGWERNTELEHKRFRDATNYSTAKLHNAALRDLLDARLSQIEQKYHGDLSALKKLSDIQKSELMNREADICSYFGWSKDMVIDHLEVAFRKDWSMIEIPKCTKAIGEMLQNSYDSAIINVKNKRQIEARPRGLKKSSTSPSRRRSKDRVQAEADRSVFETLMGVAVIVGNTRRQGDFDHSAALGTLCVRVR